jgi:anti-anti-sigma regulatory factor
MATTAVLLKIDDKNIVSAIEQAAEKLDGAEGELALDFSSVRRVQPSALAALEKLASIAESKTVKVGLRGVNVDVYKVLKLSKLTGRFTFVN